MSFVKLRYKANVKDVEQNKHSKKEQNGGHQLICAIFIPRNEPNFKIKKS